jgi:hypothetical protein
VVDRGLVRRGHDQLAGRRGGVGELVGQRARGVGGDLQLAVLGLGRALRLAGADLGEAAAVVARAWAVLQEVDVFSRARLQRTEARLAAASGDPAGAVALLERSLAALEATGHRLDQLHSLADLALALRRAGRDDEADAAAKRAGDQAAAMGAHALVRRLAEAGAPGPAGSRTGGEMGT